MMSCLKYRDISTRRRLVEKQRSIKDLFPQLKTIQTSGNTCLSFQANAKLKIVGKSERNEFKTRERARKRFIIHCLDLGHRLLLLLLSIMLHFFIVKIILNLIPINIALQTKCSWGYEAFTGDTLATFFVF